MADRGSRPRSGRERGSGTEHGSGAEPTGSRSVPLEPSHDHIPGRDLYAAVDLDPQRWQSARREDGVTAAQNHWQPLLGGHVDPELLPHQYTPREYPDQQYL